MSQQLEGGGAPSRSGRARPDGPRSNGASGWILLATSIRLAAAIVFEFFYYCCRTVVFVLFTRRRTRERIRRIMFHDPLRPEKLAVLILLLGMAVTLSPGCSAPARSDAVSRPAAPSAPAAAAASTPAASTPAASTPAAISPAGTFRRQLQEARWTLQTTADQSGWGPSLRSDAKDLTLDPNRKENLRFDLRTIFLMPDGWPSMKSDLYDLSEPDFRRHGVRESFQLLGW